MIKHPNLLVGYETADDAGVYKLTDEIAIVQTLDFFTPIVNDPYHFGRIAAANSLSDVYAMGGRPLTAMNIACFPSKDLPKKILKEILKGGLEKIHEAGALLVGGHSVDDQELKYGLSVTGIIHPKKIITNRKAQVGDRLILTKPIGIGVIAKAIKKTVASRSSINTLIKVASALNKNASEIMLKHNCHACTDITGYGLGGHLLEMARASKVKITIYADKVPLLPEAKKYALKGLIPAGGNTIKRFCEKSVEVAPGIESILIDLIFDPQTSGGLLISIGANVADACLKELKNKGIKSARIIGDILSPHPKGRLQITHSNS